MRKSTKLEKVPMPISLSKRSAKNDNAVPYRMDLNNAHSNDNKNIQEMKQQLSLIKEDVEKLLVTDTKENDHKLQTKEMNYNYSLRQEIERYKANEEELYHEANQYRIQCQEKDKEIRRQSTKYEELRRQFKIEKSKLEARNGELQERIIRLNEKYAVELKEKADKMQELSKTILHLQQQRTSEQYANHNKEVESIKEQNRLLNQKYENAIGEMKKLQTKFEKTNSKELHQLRNEKSYLEQQVVTLRLANDEFKHKNAELVSRIDRSAADMQQEKNRSHQLEERFRHLERDHVEMLREVENLRGHCSILQYNNDNLLKSINTNNNNAQQQQLPYVPESVEQLKAEIINHQVELTRMRSHMQDLIDKNKYLNVVLAEKESYIEVLEDQNMAGIPKDYYKEIENKYKKVIDSLVVDKNNMINHYQNILKNMRSELQLQPQQPVSARRANFDQILKEQIRANEDLRTNIHRLNEEIFELRNQVEDWRRRCETAKNEWEIDKVKASAELKSIKNNFEISLQNNKAEIDGLRRKLQASDKKVSSKSDEVRRKDEFIQNVVINKVDKKENEKQYQYVLKELEKWFKK